MIHWVIAFGATAGAFLILDVVWLGVMAGALYRPSLGGLLLEKFNFAAAGVFYVIYILGVLALAVHPGIQDHDASTAAGMGAILGFVAYATYDLTNLATLRGWSIKVTVVDIIWGTLLTAAAAFAGYWGAIA